MSTEDEPADDRPPVRWAPVEHLPGHLPFDHLDYGDVEQSLELANLAEPARDEPVELVDEPVRLPPPYDDRTERRRDERPLPT